MTESQIIVEKEVKDVFFEAMCAGYVSEQKIQKQHTLEFPGCKCIEFVKDKFRVQDNYCVSSTNDMSSGCITIWHEDVTIWTMSYGGCYPKKYIPFLKHALKSAYTIRYFNGGRGPYLLRDQIGWESLVYRNNVATKSDFSLFSGMEHIEDDNKVVGFHYYFGMSLI